MPVSRFKNDLNLNNTFGYNLILINLKKNYALETL